MDLDKKRMIFVQIYIKILGFGQKTILMRVDFLRFFCQKPAKSALFFGISLDYDGETNLT